jgi:hypothetical protein
MSFVEPGIIIVVFGTMAVAFGLQERSEWHRLEAWADAVLARDADRSATSFDAPAPPDLRDAA